MHRYKQQQSREKYILIKFNSWSGCYVLSVGNKYRQIWRQIVCVHDAEKLEREMQRGRIIAALANTHREERG